MMFILEHGVVERKKVLELNTTCGEDEHNCGCIETSDEIDLSENPIHPGCFCLPKSVMCDGIIDCYPIQLYSDEGQEMCGTTTVLLMMKICI